jgi:cytochrome d ubiquinol oxidase subunit II
MIAPIMGILGGILIVLAAGKNKAGLSFTGSSLAVIGAILTAGFALFPFLMPSSLNPVASLTMWDAVSSKTTLTVMTIAACIFVPIILLYTTWCYYKMWGVITNKHIKENSHSLY